MTFWQQLKQWWSEFWSGFTVPVKEIAEPIKEAIKPKPPERPSPDQEGQKLLWIPYAERLKPMKAAGKYPKGYPEGLIVHFSAGSSMRSTMDWGREQGYMFLGIDKEGNVYQTNPLNEWGHHAGVSSWPGIGSSVSNRLIGVELDCAGKLSSAGPGKWKSWFGRIVGEDKVRTVVGKDNQKKGTYEKYTEAQEAALFDLIVWLKTNNPSVFKVDWVLGHDEVAPSRKDDPGGALSMTMPELRARLNRHFWPKS